MHGDNEVSTLCDKVIVSLAEVLGEDPEIVRDCLSKLGSFDKLLIVSVSAGKMGLSLSLASEMMCEDCIENELILSDSYEVFSKKAATH